MQCGFANPDIRVGVEQVTATVGEQGISHAESTPLESLEVDFQGLAPVEMDSYAKATRPKRLDARDFGGGAGQWIVPSEVIATRTRAQSISRMCDPVGRRNSRYPL